MAGSREKANEETCSCVVLTGGIQYSVWVASCLEMSRQEVMGKEVWKVPINLKN